MSRVGLLNARTAVVTGGVSGIGSAIVERFAREGATGTVLDTQRAGDAFPPGWLWSRADVRDDQAVGEALASLGHLDVVVAAAGIVPPWRSLVEASGKEWNEVFQVNVLGVLATLRHALPRMRPGGSIVAIGSVNSWRGDPNVASYVASKHAVLGLVRSAALDAGRLGIRVNAVAPGPIATKALLNRMSERQHRFGIPTEEALATAASQTALRRLATVDEVASAVLFLASDLSSGVTGQLLHVDAGVL